MSGGLHLVSPSHSASDVLAVADRLKVVGIDTDTVATSMIQLSTLRDRADQQLIRNTVR